MGSITVRVPPHLLPRARQIATNMRTLSRYELLGISPKTVLRIALVEGAHLANRAEAKYLRPEHAAALREKREPHINNSNVMLTDGCYVDHVFMTKVVECGHVRASADEEKDSKDLSIDLRLPTARFDEVQGAITKGLTQGIPSRSRMVRILLEVGLVKLDARTYWDQRREGFIEDRYGNLHPPGSPTRNAKTYRRTGDEGSSKDGGDMSIASLSQQLSVFHRLFVYPSGEGGFQVLVKPDLDQRGAAQEKPAVLVCADASDLRQCFEELRVDGSSHQVGERADVPVFAHVPCSIQEAVLRAGRRPSPTFIVSHSPIAEMRKRLAAVKRRGIRIADRVQEP